MKFAPEHFPVGTVFRLSKEAQRLDLPEILTCAFVSNYGPSSFLIHTKEVTVDGMFEGKQYSLNIAHVESIVKRGQGRVVIRKHQRLSDNELRASLLKDVKMMELTLDGKPGRGYWQTGSLQMLITYLLFIHTGEISDFKSGLLFRAITDQTWCKMTPMGEGKRFMFHYYRINKKRLKAFIAANWSRYLKPMKQQLAEESALMDEEYARYEAEWNEEYDRKHGVNEAFDPEASSYSTYDGFDDHPDDRIENYAPMLGGS